MGERGNGAGARRALAVASPVLLSAAALAAGARYLARKDDDDMIRLGTRPEGLPDWAAPDIADALAETTRKLDQAVAGLERERARGIWPPMPVPVARAALACLAGVVMGGALILMSLMFPGHLGWILWLGGFWAAAGSAIGWIIVMLVNASERMP